jgi:hypothetical protein
MGSHQLPLCAADDNKLGDKINAVMENAEALIDASKEISLGANVEDSMNML